MAAAGLPTSCAPPSRQPATNTAPIELLVENEDYFKSCKLDYHEGEKYPRLERDPTKPDLLSEILKPLAPARSAFLGASTFSAGSAGR